MLEEGHNNASSPDNNQPEKEEDDSDAEMAKRSDSVWVMDETSEAYGFPKRSLNFGNERKVSSCVAQASHRSSGSRPF
jgi:hypothetical protein